MADLSELTGQLWTGAAITTSQDVQQIADLGITADVDLRLEFDDSSLVSAYDNLPPTPDALKNHPTIAYLHNGTADDGIPKPVSWFQTTWDFVQPILKDGGVVLVHCVPPDTMVGARVPRPIREVGARVIDHEGYERDIVAPMERPYDGEMLTLHARGTLPIRATPEHPFLVLRPYRNSGGRIYKPNWKSTFDALARSREHDAPEWVKAGEVQRGDFLLSPKWHVGGGAQMGFVAPTHHNAQRVALEPDDDLAWLFGVFIGDGHAGSGGVRLTMGDGDDVDRAVAVIEQIGVRPLVRTARESIYCRRVEANSTALGLAFRKWFGVGAPNKRIPEWAFNGLWNIEAILDGIIAADGTRSKRGETSLYTTSLTLAYQVWHLVASRGDYPYLKQRRWSNDGSGFPNGKPAWRVAWRDAKQHYTARFDDYYALPVGDIDRQRYVGPVCNIEVADSHSYLVNGVASHNCAAGINRGPSMAHFVLRAYDGMSSDDAYNLIKEKRPVANVGYRTSSDAAIKALGLGS